MADMLFPDDYGIEQKKQNYEYYEKITTHDSSLSRSIFGILAAKLGYQKKSEDYFMATALTDLIDLQGNTEDGLHMANLGGSWLGLVYGFAGLEVSAQSISINNHLPASWPKLQFEISYQSRKLLINLNHVEDQITRVSGVPIDVRLNGHVYRI
ncbi:glycosyl hydrolase family 65 protein [Oenococcus sp.]|uniref:glycosyl hydrolase family 65 protein n=1 Tax=Oenococcus sp. TaxID=1979414 RepID=UPI0039EA3346